MSAFPLADAQTAVQWRESGQMVDLITRAILISAEAELGYPLTMVQGGNKPKTSYSGTTHTKLGVGDLAAYDWENKCRVLNGLGCYAYHRPYMPGVWGEHLHFGVIDHPYRDGLLAAQQDDWLKNPPLNGLSGHARYTDGPHTNGKKIVFKYDPSTKLEVVPMTKVDLAKEELVKAIHNIGDSAALLDDVDPKRVVARAEIDNLKKLHKDARGILKRLPAH